MIRRYSLTLLAATLFAASATSSFANLGQDASLAKIAEPPVSPAEAFAAMAGEQLILAGGESSDIYAYSKTPGLWVSIGSLDAPRAKGTGVTHNGSVILVGGTIDGTATDKVTKLTPNGTGVDQQELTPLPRPMSKPAATISGGTLYVSDGSNGDGENDFYTLDLGSPNASWQEIDSWTGPARSNAFLVKSVETLALIGGHEAGSLATNPSSLSYHARYGWNALTNEGPQGEITSAVKLGDAHAVATVKSAANEVDLYLYHMVGDTWVSLGENFAGLPADTQVVGDNYSFYILSAENSGVVTFGQPETNYGWWDHLSVALYFVVMLWIGFHFAKQSKNSDDYFRGGHKIPWWATGMSLFATGASAMSLMAMPGKAYAGNWTFFAISIYSILCLPIAMYFYAPVIRKLNFGTAFEYLENRFGLSVRLIGSTIFAVYQILGRMGGVLLLPSFALEAIAGIPMYMSVPIMGVVTIAYTFLGGLSAVIWTDTIQGFVMIAAVGGCLLLVFFRIDIPFNEMWTTLDAQDKLHVFDWGISLTDENVFTVFVGIVFVTLLGIGDQNFVQRVQCGPSLSSTRKAVLTQMAVAVPINLLLFALGTALFLFYQQSPEELNPAMKNDGIYPFFAAQQLPPGVSGLVIAALLAATMSTISSSICSVSNLAVDDVYKRFSSAPTETKAVLVGRVITVLVGVFGIASAFYLNSFETPSIWDLALRVVSIVTATTVGIYFLGLFTQRSNEIGVLVGIVAGMGSTYYVSNQGTVVFWLYPVVGSFVTIVVGYLVSILTGGNKKNIEGLTLATLSKRTGGLDD